MNNEQKDEVVSLYLDDIIPNRFQPREVFDEKALKELAKSIREHGVIQPILVRNVGGKYEIIAGERRYKASALAGFTKIPAIIRNLDDKESSKVALLENLQRKNLSPIEEARTYQKILEIDQMTQEELANTMGKSQSSVANKLRLLTLPDEVQLALLKEQISERHARCLLNIPDVQKQKEMLKQIIANKMSVRSVEEEIKKMYPKEKDIMENRFLPNEPLEPTTIENISSDSKDETFEESAVDSQPKFINYGEVNSEDEMINFIPDQMNTNETVKSVDVNTIRQNSSDINVNNSGNVDSLLNIGPNAKMPVNGSDFKFLTPAEGIVKESYENEASQKDEYFKLPDNDNFNDEIPENFMSNLDTVYTIEQAKDMIRKLIEDLKKHGVELTFDEMNFDKSYQIIIKLLK